MNCKKKCKKRQKSEIKKDELKIQNKNLRKNGHNNKILRLYPLQGPQDSCW